MIKAMGKGMELMLQIISQLPELEKGTSWFLPLEKEGLIKHVPKKGKAQAPSEGRKEFHGMAWSP